MREVYDLAPVTLTSSRRTALVQPHVSNFCARAWAAIGTKRGAWSKACFPSPGIWGVTRKCGFANSSPSYRTEDLRREIRAGFVAMQRPSAATAPVKAVAP